MPDQNMPDKKQNDIAAALAAMAGGAVPSEHESPSGGIPSETTVFTERSDSSVSPEPMATRDCAAPLIAPQTNSTQSNAAQASSAQATPSRAARLTPAPPPRHLPGSGPTARPAAPRPQRQSAPPAPAIDQSTAGTPPTAYIRQAAGTAPRERPAMPERSAQGPARLEEPQPTVEAPSDFLPEIVDDEETIAAAPDASVFVHRETPRKAHTPHYAQVNFRRTLIPIMLTCGGLLIGIGIWLMLDHDTPLAAIGLGAKATLIAVGSVLGGLGVLNAFHVRHIMETLSRESAKASAN